MMHKKKYNLIIADDHKMFLDGLKSIFLYESEYDVIFIAHSGLDVEKYINKSSEKKIDLAILDINMPIINGVNLNKFIKTHHPNIKTLMVSMLSDPNKIFQLIKDNVDGYVSKNATKTELLQAISTILKGEKYFSEHIKNACMESVFNEKKENTIILTKREKEILILIAQELTTNEIADKLFLSRYTIEGYRSSLISKLAVKNIAGLVKYAIKSGLVE